jgi:tetratricopeptide (TPR) repeat protein
MQNTKIQTRKQTERGNKIDSLKRKGLKTIPFFTAFFLFTLFFPGLSQGVEKKLKKQPAQSIQKDIAINDSNIQGYFKKAEELTQKGELENSLKIFLKIYDHTKGVLNTVQFFHAYYEKTINEPSITQNQKEETFIKLKRMEQLISKYNSMKEITTYHMGYIYAKKGDSERARKYLIEVLSITPFSTEQDSICMKSKTLLLGLYNLEGEF